jgi:hypothetical protein
MPVYFKTGNKILIKKAFPIRCILSPGMIELSPGVLACMPPENPITKKKPSRNDSPDGFLYSYDIAYLPNGIFGIPRIILAAAAGLENCFITFRISSNCLISLFTSVIFVPEPFAIRVRRL